MLENHRSSNEQNDLPLSSYEDAIHDIKAPLTIMFSVIKRLEQDFDSCSKGEIQESIETLKKQCFRSIKLISDASDSQKLYKDRLAPDLRNYDIESIMKEITEAAKLLAKRKEITLHYTSQATKVISAMDKEMLERIILNLLANAIKFTDEGGFIEVVFQQTGKAFTIQIQDNGAGIERESLDNIYDRYYSGGSKGTGIGLSIVWQLTHLLGGDIHIQSGNTGTHVYLSFPIYVLEDSQEKRKYYDDFYTDNIVQIELSDI